MHRFHMLCLLALLLTLAAPPSAFCRDEDDPKALLRVDSAADASKRFYVEIILVAPLSAGDLALLTCYRDRPSGPCAGPEPRVGFLMSKGRRDKSFAPNTAVLPPDDDAAQSGKRLRIYLPEAAAPFTDFDKRDFRVALHYTDAEGAEQELNFPVGLDFERAVGTGTAVSVCNRERLGISLKYDPTEQYDKDRITAIRDYFEAVRTNPSRLAELQVTVRGQGGATETLSVSDLALTPERDFIGSNSKLTLCLRTSKRLPEHKFEAQLTFGADAPPEIATPALAAGIDGVAAQASPTVINPDEKAPGIRAFDKDLNIAALGSSSVKDVEKDKQKVRERQNVFTFDFRAGLRNIKRLGVHVDPSRPLPDCGRVKAFTPPSAAPGKIVFEDAEGKEGREVIIAPNTTLGGVPVVAGQELCVSSGSLPNLLGQLVAPVTIAPDAGARRTSARYSIFTPVFFDGRVSTGKITEDTLSLNRVVIGTQWEYQYRYNNATFPTFYSFVFKGSHASDRDFKQAEFKGTFEFRPQFGPLFHPLDSYKGKPGRTLGGKLEAIPSDHGYEVIPLVGFEIGRTYMRRRPAEAIKPSDTVRRFYFGLELVYNPTRDITFSAEDNFYFRGESKDDPRHNYFLGEFSYKLGTFARGQAAHAIYFSFERGGQPPFDNPDVNALKLGYRITADTLFSTFKR